MGVKHLWDIIDETKCKETLDYMRGKIISVDLSIWIVEAMKTLQFKTSVLKPHLRNMFYRILALRKLGIKLLFVTEGDAPDLKQNTMKKRNEMRYGLKSTTKSRVGRSRFQTTIKECCRLLDLLGMPHVKAAGEAEAMCAVLNLYGYSDGCLTNDGDFFLYGGQIIYRDFGIDPKDPHVFVYDIETIKTRLNINRNDMIGLALICGCDYTNGVAGVGKGLITNLLEERSFTEDLLSRFKKWHTRDFLTSEDLMKSETIIARKAIKSGDFLNQQIIDEYLINKDMLNNVNEKLKWGYPNIKGLQEFLFSKMEWPFEYTLSKIMQLASSAYLEKIADNIFYPVLISPTHIVKTRCQHGVALVEINWEKDVSQVYDVDMKWENCPDTFTTLEDHQVVLNLLPGLVETYVQLKESKKAGKTKKKETKSRKGVKCTEQPNVNLVNDVTEDDSSENQLKMSQNITNGYQVKSKMADSHCSFPQESQEYNNFKISSRDFLTDVLCEDIKEISLHDVKRTNEKPCHHEDNIDSDNENVLPLFQRLRRKTSTKNKNSFNDSKEGIVVCEEDENTVDQVIISKTTNGNEPSPHLQLKESRIKQKVESPCLLAKSAVINNNSIEIKDLLSSSILDGLGSQFFSSNEAITVVDDLGSDCSTQKKYLARPSLNSINFSNSSPSLNSNSLKVNKFDDIKITPLRQAYSTPQGVKKRLSGRTDGILVESTPICFQSETPTLQNNTPRLIHSNHSSVFASSTPLFRETNQPLVSSIRSPVLQDITNFSNLGDSILGHSMDLFEAYDEVESSKEPNNKFNTISNPKPNLSHYGESNLCDSLDLCEPSILISKLSAFGDSILCESLDLANVCGTSDNKRKLSRSTCNRDNSRKVLIPEVSKNYEDLLREKFQISLTCDDVSMGSISKCSNNSLSGSNNFSMVEGSPLCLADRLKYR